jgi:hypothetical protein
MQVQSMHRIRVPFADWSEGKPKLFAIDRLRYSLKPHSANSFPFINI